MGASSAIKRRVIFGVLAVMGASKTTAADHVGQALAQLTGALEAQYGGRWSAHFDHLNGFVLVTAGTDLARQSK